ncbi:heavy-metal-associated domain-containing protein [Capnocytophaga catalasegens]|uniref:HMA domain-containing protein n=1 Tax=Capnocytophaga catalasegens TaxID=1004260 RepID=A0AAV5AS55_9FLAO|nr:cation transporter [Capnocytophaga catalasegens]GIZ15019.1 hypothetical protein RCZ03_10190 [Capnocytophaga catalasegens]GJM49399.1 hypothetical protein RCZ15_03740 [Capnocytophaga catalasegens]GJM52549.1 hypothetical protein RCZ16_08660 [Capnocytophaga catalasegens]
MDKMQFKTNFKCQGCVDKVAKEFDMNEQIKSWKVDLTSSDKTLEVETSLSESEIQALVSKAGYKAEVK